MYCPVLFLFSPQLNPLIEELHKSDKKAALFYLDFDEQPRLIAYCNPDNHITRFFVQLIWIERLSSLLNCITTLIPEVSEVLSICLHRS